MNQSSPVKRSLVLAGGGMRLAYHAGVLIAFEEEGLSFNHVDGTSGGIFGTAMLASGISPAEAATRWRRLNLNGFMAILPLKDYRNQHSLPAMGSADGVRKKIFPSLGIDIKKINSNTAFDATFNVCNFSMKSIESIPHYQATEDHLIAGISLPVFMPAVRINETWYTDAVWIKDANLTEAVNRGAGEIWLIWCIGNTPEYLNGFFNQYVHMIEMSADGGLVQELNWIKEQNSQRLKNNIEPIIVHLIKPDYPLPLDPEFFLGKIDADTLINMGYADTKQYLQNKSPINLSETCKAAKMKSPGVTLHFRQRFKGTIMLDGILKELVLRLAFFIHDTPEGYVWRQFASVEPADRKVASGYQNTVTAGKGNISSSFMIYLSGLKYQVQVDMRLQSTIDFLLGIDSKAAAVTISREGWKGKAVFFQDAVSRIRNAWFLNIKAETGWWGKLKSKNRLLETVFK